jgi:hypothetical protein
MPKRRCPYLYALRVPPHTGGTDRLSGERTAKSCHNASPTPMA